MATIITVSYFPLAVPSIITPSPEEPTTDAPTTTEEAAPTTTEEAAPTTTEEAAPTTTEEAAPTTTEEAAPTTTEEAAPTTTEEAAPTTTEEAAPTTTEEAAPTTTETAPPTTTEETTPCPGKLSCYCPKMLDVFTLFSYLPEITGGLYFELNGNRYPSGSTVLISDVGPSPLVCVTSDVNTQCCRGRDGGNVGEWQFPDGSMVPRLRGNPNADFTRSGFTQQVLLNRKDTDVGGPTGLYTCMVPSECDGAIQTGNITLGKQRNMATTPKHKNL